MKSNRLALSMLVLALILIAVASSINNAQAELPNNEGCQTASLPRVILVNASQAASQVIQEKPLPQLIISQASPENISPNETTNLVEVVIGDEVVIEVNATVQNVSNVSQGIVNESQIENVTGLEPVINETEALINLSENATPEYSLPAINETAVNISITNQTTEIKNETIISIVTNQTANVTIQANESLQINESMAQLNVTETLTQLPAEINKPVRWIQVVRLNQSRLIKVRHTANIVSIKAIGHEANLTINLDNVKAVRKSLRRMLVGRLSSLIGIPLQEGEEDELLIEDPAAENATAVELTLETPAPVVHEVKESEYKKNVTVSADDEYNYTNILTYTSVPDVPKEAIRLYWLVNGSRQPVEIIEYVDANNNSLVDWIRWITPHLSEQVFVVEITVLNLQSYPMVGRNW
ncbi:hypothetical protein COT48_02250, partial [Candidatus Woesearchaeota archaeon CG08_land_8_20_14_0_20_47_9]